MRQYIITKDAFKETDIWQPGCWVNVECPDNDDFAFLTQTLHIPDFILAYANDIDERPRIERDGEWLLTIVRIPARAQALDTPIYTVPVAVITGPDVTVTVCYYPNEVIHDFIIHGRSRQIAVTSQSNFVLRVIYSSAFWFLEFLKVINSRVQEAAKQLERSVQNSDLLGLMSLQKTLVYFSTSLQGNEMLIERLSHVFTDMPDRDLLEDVQIEIRQAENTTNIYTEILSGTMDTYASVISNNVNQIMKRMTSITIVLMVPTLIASFYGMNVDIGISGLPHAFFWVVVGAAVLTVLAFLFLKHIKWF